MKKIELKKLLCTIGAASVLASLGAMQVLAEGTQGVPFVAALSGTAMLDLNNAEAHCTGTGMATHLGRTTSQCTAVLDFSGYMPYDECSGGYGLPNVNTMTLTSADGDRLVIVSIDLACEIVQLTSFHGTGVWSVDSAKSTGRFSGVTGAGNLDGFVDFSAGTVQVSLIGQISY